VGRRGITRDTISTIPEVLDELASSVEEEEEDEF